MASWSNFEHENPEFAQRVQSLFDAHRHKIMATIRRDGSPRTSGIEVSFIDGQMIVGMSAGSMKSRDVARDNRVCIHSASDDPPDAPANWPGDARIAGRVFKMPDSDDPDRPIEDSTRYRVDIDEAVLNKIGEPADHLSIESWHAGRGYRRRRMD
ncbi:MAG TPA: pyridoxamine 5'-phosphate oxidase family protein [Chloroflexota bacterium]|jgi:hypothetical protein|nr:pyridoxamine 5'-phosphate oxidase family protein [Chloroflexota bacterium]